MTPAAALLLSLAWHCWNAHRVWSDPGFGTFICSVVSSLLLISCEVSGGYGALIAWEVSLAVIETVGTGLLLLGILRNADRDAIDGEVVAYVVALFSGLLAAQGGRIALCLLITGHLGRISLSGAQ